MENRQFLLTRYDSSSAAVAGLVEVSVNGTVAEFREVRIGVAFHAERSPFFDSIMASQISETAPGNGVVQIKRGDAHRLPFAD